MTWGPSVHPGVHCWTPGHQLEGLWGPLVAAAHTPDPGQAVPQPSGLGWRSGVHLPVSPVICSHHTWPPRRGMMRAEVLPILSDTRFCFSLFDWTISQDRQLPWWPWSRFLSWQMITVHPSRVQHDAQHMLEVSGAAERTVVPRWPSRPCLAAPTNSLCHLHKPFPSLPRVLAFEWGL